MPELLRMPVVETSAETATLCEWIVKEGQNYSANDVLATIETDKAIVDLDAGADGVVLRILVSAGTEAQVGAPIALIARADEAVEDIDAALATLAVTASPAGSSAVPLTVDPPGGSPVPATAEPELSGCSGAESRQGQENRIFVSPVARRLARSADIAIESITGSGPNGRIVRRDVELAVASRHSADPSAEPSRFQQVQVLTGPSVAPPPPFVALPTLSRKQRESLTAAAFTEVPHSRARRAIAQRMTESKQTVPHYYLRGSARVDELIDLRARLNETAPAKISVNDFVIKAAAHAHQVVPAMNVVWTEGCVRQMLAVDLGVAVATASGLVTPVLRGVESLSISVVAAATCDFAKRAREGQLHQHELDGGSSTVTNLGMYGTEEFAAIINPPQSSILAVGEVRKEPVATKKGGVRLGSVMRLTLSVDHRPIDGATAAQWMRAVLEALEQPIRLLI